MRKSSLRACRGTQTSGWGEQAEEGEPVGERSSGNYLLRDFKDGTVLDAVACGGVQNDNAALAGVATAITAMNKKARSPAHVS